MLSISRRCVPFTPYEREISEAVVTIVSAAGIHLSSQEPFPSEDPGDISFREIPGDTAGRDLRITHHHYDHSDADVDPNVMFPLESLRELRDEGFIKGVAEVHYSLGFTSRLRELYEQTHPEIARRIARSRAKLAVLTAGCPSICHRPASNLAREIESIGVPTVIISANPAATESVRPPRAMTFEGSAIGRVLGPPHARTTHTTVLRSALQMFLETTRPGTVTTRVIAPG